MPFTSEFSVAQLRQYFRDKKQFNVLLDMRTLHEAAKTDMPFVLSVKAKHDLYRMEKSKTPLPGVAGCLSFCVEDLFDILEREALFEKFMTVVSQHDYWKSVKVAEGQNKPDDYYTKDEEKFCLTEL